LPRDGWAYDRKEDAVSDIEDRLRRFIVTELSWEGDLAAIPDDYELIKSDVLDSLGVQQVVALVEEEFGVEIADDELVPENFATLRAIGDLVRSKGA
jgi:acyl carrier protein